MNLDQYLKQESEKRQFQWNDVSAWTTENAQFAWDKTGESVFKGYKNLHPNLTQDLIYYLLRDKRFSKDLDKGILLIGESGTGKTVILRILNLLMGHLHNKKFPFYSAKQIERILRLPSEHPDPVTLWTDIVNSTFGFDDLGKENSKVKTMGTDINIGMEILEARHLEFINKGALTFSTSNMGMRMIDSKYGSHIEGRVLEMFNIFVVKGANLRKK